MKMVGTGETAPARESGGGKGGKGGKPTKAWWGTVVFRMPPEDIATLKSCAYSRRLSVSDVIRGSLAESGVLKAREV